MGLDEVHVSVFRQEGHQLVIGPEMEGYDLLLTGKHMARPSWRWNIDFAVQCILLSVLEETYANESTCY